MESGAEFQSFGVGPAEIRSAVPSLWVSGP
jgi:hypothetical protein